MNRIIITVLLLVISNTFMTFAWYAHLRHLAHKPWIIAALVSWALPCVNTCFRFPQTGSATKPFLSPNSKLFRKSSRSPCSFPLPFST